MTKVIIPAAGQGTRFSPLTKVLPKEMLPLADKPAIQYVAEEAVFSGLKDLIFITKSSKQLIEEHFSELASQAEGVWGAKGVTPVYLHQTQPLGLGHAVMLAKSLISEPYFGVALPDDILSGASVPCLGQIARLAQQEKGSVIAVREVGEEEVSRYGVVAIKKQITPSLYQIKEVVEKPASQMAPSNLAIVGRYMLSRSIFEYASQVGEGCNGEVQLTDMIQEMIAAGERVFAYKVQGTYLDAGSPEGYLKAVVQAALRHPTYGPDFQAYLAQLDLEREVFEGKVGRFKYQEAAL